VSLKQVSYDAEAGSTVKPQESLESSFNNTASNVAFTHAGLTTGTEQQICIKVILCCKGHAIYILGKG